MTFLHLTYWNDIRFHLFCYNNITNDISWFVKIIIEPPTSRTFWTMSSANFNVILSLFLLHSTFNTFLYFQHIHLQGTTWHLLVIIIVMVLDYECNCFFSLSSTDISDNVSRIDIDIDIDMNIIYYLLIYSGLVLWKAKIWFDFFFLSSIGIGISLLLLQTSLTFHFLIFYHLRLRLTECNLRQSSFFKFF